MENHNQPSEKHWAAVFYKLLCDILFLLLLTLSLMLIIEAVIPGLVSPHLSFTRLTLLIFANLAAIIYFQNKNNFPAFFAKNINKKLLAGLIFFSLIFIANSLLGFEIWEIAIILVITLFMFLCLYKMLLLE